jgi:hypothetical protein
MSKIMYSQKWFAINEYPLDYFELLYQYYASFGVRTPITYYNFDVENSVGDKSLLNAGAYEVIGNLSGYLWRKIMMLPVYNFEQIQFAMNADESGVGFPNQQTTFFIPASYEFYPRVNDFYVYDQISWREDFLKTQAPVYQIVNLEKTSSTHITFFRVTAQISQYKKDQLEKQISGTYAFVDYEKQIYKSDDAILLQSLQLKNSKLMGNNFFKENCGLYLERAPEATPIPAPTPEPE